MDNMRNLEDRVAKLEFINDQLTSELAYVNELLYEVGFSGGLEALKEVAVEIIDEKIEQQD